MKIDFRILIKNSGEKLSQRKLAKEMVAAKHYTTLDVAINAIQNFNQGRAKEIKVDLLFWIAKRFNQKSILDFFKW